MQRAVHRDERRSFLNGLEPPPDLDGSTDFLSPGDNHLGFMRSCICDQCLVLTNAMSVFESPSGKGSGGLGASGAALSMIACNLKLNIVGYNMCKLVATWKSICGTID